MRRKLTRFGILGLLLATITLSGCYETEVKFSITPISCDTFLFDATESKGAYSYHWDFGDGETSDEPFVTHTYEEDGIYVVRLTIEDAYEQEKSTWATVEVDCRAVENSPPIAHLAIIGDYHGASGKYWDTEMITFDGSSSYDPDFDRLTFRLVIDGKVHIEESTDHFVTSLPGPMTSGCCSSPEVYLVTLTVSDGLAESTVSRHIEIYNSGCDIR